MTPAFGYGLAFVTGIFGAFHCIGMCSGINAGFFASLGRFPAPSAVIGFHATRIGVYTLLGVGGALAGRVLAQSGMVGKIQGVLMIVAGVLVTALGLLMLLRSVRTEATANSSRLVALPALSATSAFPPKVAPVAGLLNGLVPCSLVFSVAIKAAATSDPLQAGLLMLAFGAGTLPAMGAVSLMGAWIGARSLEWFARLAALGVILLGLWTLYEGAVFFNIMSGLASW